VTAMSHASSSSLKRKRNSKEIQKKRNIKSRKIDKEKRKKLVSKAFHNIILLKLLIRSDVNFSSSLFLMLVYLLS